jgi:hypothetical protein
MLWIEASSITRTQKLQSMYIHLAMTGPQIRLSWSNPHLLVISRAKTLSFRLNSLQHENPIPWPTTTSKGGAKQYRLWKTMSHYSIIFDELVRWIRIRAATQAFLSYSLKARTSNRFGDGEHKSFSTQKAAYWECVKRSVSISVTDNW